MCCGAVKEGVKHGYGDDGGCGGFRVALFVSIGPTCPSLPLFIGRCRTCPFSHRQPGSPRHLHGQPRRSPNFHGFRSPCISSSFRRAPSLHALQTRFHYPQTRYHDLPPRLPVSFFGTTTTAAAATVFSFSATTTVTASSSVVRFFLPPQPIPSSASLSRASSHGWTTR